MGQGSKVMIHPAFLTRYFAQSVALGQRPS